MIRYFLLIIFSLLCSSSFAQFTTTIQWQNSRPSNSGDTIYYNPERKLNWEDFTGKPDAASPAAAITESGFGYRMSMNSVNSKIDLVITVFCYFNKKHSWVKKNMDSEYALLHEQHHYDITYINACLFIKKLQEAQFNKGNFNQVVDKIHDECFKALENMQNEYDSQTLNGRIDRQQKIWNKKIDQQLAALITN
jgi:hypothetical protein